MSFAPRLLKDFAWEVALTGVAEKLSTRESNTKTNFLNIFKSFSQVRIIDLGDKKLSRFEILQVGVKKDGEPNLVDV